MIGPKRGEQLTGAVLRPVLISTAYFLLFTTLDWMAGLFEKFPNVSHLNLPAGLNLSFLLIYGAGYTVHIILAQLAADLWINPLPTGLGDTAVFAGTLGAAYLGAANLVSHLFGKVRSRIQAPFLLAGLITAVCVSLATVLNLSATELITWTQLPEAFAGATVGTALGILYVTPFFTLCVAPHFEIVLRSSRSGGRAEEDALTLPKQAWKAPFLAVTGGAAVIAVVIGLVIALEIENKLLILCLLFPPFVGTALLSGLELVSAAIFGSALGSALMFWIAGLQFQSTLEFQLLLLVVFLNAILVGTIVGEKKLIQGAGSYRDAVLKSINFAAEKFAEVDDWHCYLTEVLQNFGKASGASHVCVLEQLPGKNDPRFEPLPCDWTSSDFPADPHRIRKLSALIRRALARRSENVREVSRWHAPPPELSETEREAWVAAGIFSIFVVPIPIEQQIWGYLVLERGASQQKWTTSEIKTLEAAARALGNLIVRARIAEQIQQLASNVRLEGEFWISSPDGLQRMRLSATSEPLGSKRQGQVQGVPGAWMQEIDPEDLVKVKAVLSAQEEFDMEYRVVEAEQGVRWVRDRGFPVPDEAGDISRFIGVTQDITAQKQVETEVQQNIHLLAGLIDKLGSSVLVEDEECRICHVNVSFFETLDTAIPNESVIGRESSTLFSRFPGLSSRVDEIRHRGIPVIAEEIRSDGITLKCSYIPLSISQKFRYHLWQLQSRKEEKQALQPVEERSLQGKDAVMQEMHESVGNDLRIIYGLLRLQSSMVRDEQEFRYLVSDQDRVLAMALVHDRLSRSPDVDFPVYTRDLTEQLLKSYKGNSQAVRLKLELEPLPMDVNLAIPCGLIVNELVSNSLKYAFPGNRQGEILIRLHREGEGDIRLLVRDDGVGFPQALDFKTTQTLGLMLVTGLTEQLGGSIFLRSDHGTEFEIRFPLDGSSTQ